MERTQLVVGLSYFVPLAKKVARVSVYAFAVKQLAPAIRPITFGLIQRGLANRGRSGLFKLAGLASTAIGAARAFSSRRSES
ncbi:hypothetical protein [Thalassobacterium sedimentorum]|uniref:hypothetical protein n=1 Tax=Thalassobacterium sedimentorum TaxID=3041258 RepID=UPI002810AB86|nr:hypothetical protein [Coraliomargarita sp. SDUM461004]